MAITRTQIARQLYKNGRRVGLFKGAQADASAGKGSMSPGTSGLGGSQAGGYGRDQGNRGDQQGDMSIRDFDTTMSNPDGTPNRFNLAKINDLNIAEKIRINSLKNLYDQKFGLKKTIPSFLSSFSIFNPALKEYKKSDPEFDDYGMTGDNLTDTDRLADAINNAEATGNITQGEFTSAFFGPDGPPGPPEGGEGALQDPCRGPNPPAYCFTGLRSAEAATPEVEEDDEIINYRLMNKGGMADETVGGIMDLESSRQMYGLGKLVKKVTRSVKKIAKSDLGKAALVAAGGYALGGGFSAAGFSKGSLMSRLGLGSFDGYQRAFTKNALGKFLTNKATLGIGIPAIASYFMTPKEEEQETLYAGADIADPRFIMANNRDFTNTRLLAEGGSTEEKEPVAKKVMPLLDMEGQEKDYRETGGFVDMGRMEKADDVPARLSKNEFVFTADAVRNAGDGSVDKGAEVMYNMMKNLESGGDVSEESQGLEGARDMFKTSQRLEEVL